MMFLFFLSTTLNFIFKLAELSKNAHALAKRYYEKNDLEAREELKEVEEEIDKIVAELYGTTDESWKR
jgi:Na+/phosphate symporter